MLDRDYPDQVCSVARALEVVGERWTLLIVRDVLLGVHRFDELVASVGATPAMLTRRLRRLVAEGVLERRLYQDRPRRYEYHPTDKGRDLIEVLAVLMRWGDRHYGSPAGPPRLLVHDVCGQPITPQLACGYCNEPVQLPEVNAQAGPGAARH